MRYLPSDNTQWEVITIPEAIPIKQSSPSVSLAMAECWVWLVSNWINIVMQTIPFIPSYTYIFLLQDQWMRPGDLCLHGLQSTLSRTTSSQPWTRILHFVALHRCMPAVKCGPDSPRHHFYNFPIWTFNTGMHVRKAWMTIQFQKIMCRQSLDRWLYHAA